MKEVRFSKETEAKDEELSPEKAALLYKEGGFYIVKDLIPGSEFGCDMKSWNTGQKFLGLKMIPAGIHYIYYSSVSKDKDVSPRRGFFINIQPGQLIVHRFDPTIEEIVDDVSEVEVERFRENLKNIDGNLGAYPHQSWSKWVSLSSRLKYEKVKQYQSIVGDNSLDVKYNFTEVSKQKYPDGSSAAEVTKHSLDSTYQLQKFCENLENIEMLLVELQLAFVLFLVGQDYESFNQWKLMVDMMCGCGDALNKYPKLFTCFIDELHFQLQEVPEDFFIDIISCNNFLVMTLTNLFCNIREFEAETKLKSKAISFENHLTKKFGWTFADEEDDEFCPVVVD